MKKRVFIVHAWGYSPKNNWYPWIKKKLESKDFIVGIPSMPNTESPKIEAWVPYLSKIVGKIDKNTFFIGHSVGCQTIIRYLEQLSSGEKVGGAVFVAGFLKPKQSTLTGLTTEEKQIIKPWLETPIDLAKIKQHVGNFTAIFSTNDPYVLLDNKDIFEKKLGAKIIIEKNKGHFDESSGVTKLPIVLSEILKLAK
jgi:uncharacterized protein